MRLGPRARDSRVVGPGAVERACDDYPTGYPTRAGRADERLPSARNRGDDPPALSYAVVTPVRDDAPNLRRLGQCLIRQSLQPSAWVIVDDGSTDDTLAVARAFMRQASWVFLVEKGGERSPTRGAPIAEAFELGVERLQHKYDVVVKADADVAMAPEFFARLLREFVAEPRLGVASGTRFEQMRGAWRQRHLTATSVEAQCRAYRARCIESVLPLDRHRGWDGVDVYKAQLHGWKTLVVKDLPFFHHRAIGDRDGSRFRAWAGGGAGAYSMGYRPLYLLCRCLFHAAREPAAFGLLLGFTIAALSRQPRASRTVRSRVRHDQALAKLVVRAREVSGRQDDRTRRRDGHVDLMLVAEPGGHLIEMCALQPAWERWRRVWVTLDGPDSRSLLRGETVVAAKGPTCRSVRNLLRNMWIAWKVVGRYRPAVILATGAGLVVPLIWVGRLRGVKTIYVECGGRVDTPSLSCKLVAPVTDHLYVQWPELRAEVPAARHAGTIRWDVAQGAGALTPGLVFATVGTSLVYPFDRLVRGLQEASRRRPVTIQYGIATARPDGATLIDFLPFDALSRCIATSDVVVTHGGIGSVLLALANGKRPIVMPRSRALGESVDDHQLAFARRLEEAGFATVVTTEEELAAAVASPGRHSAPVAPLQNLTDELTTVIEGLLAPDWTSDDLSGREPISPLPFGSARSV